MWTMDLKSKGEVLYFETGRFSKLIFIISNFSMYRMVSYVTFVPSIQYEFLENDIETKMNLLG